MAGEFMQQFEPLDQTSVEANRGDKSTALCGVALLLQAFLSNCAYPG
jgi:hypothetical protein